MVSILFAQAILSLPIPTRPSEDKLIWVPDFRGEFSVKSAYQISSQQVTSNNLSEALWKKLWKIDALERVRMLLWRIASNALPRKDNLSQRMHIDNPTCVLRGNAPKSTCHLFILCLVTWAIWFTSCWGLRADELNIVDCLDMVKLILDPLKSSNLDLDSRPEPSYLPRWSGWCSFIKLSYLEEIIWTFQAYPWRSPGLPTTP